MDVISPAPAGGGGGATPTKTRILADARAPSYSSLVLQEPPVIE